VRKIGVFISDDRLSEYVYKKLSGAGATCPFSFSSVGFTESAAFKPGDVNGILLYLKKENIKELVFIGRISPETAFAGNLHVSGSALLEKAGLLQGERILGGLTSYLAKEGIKVLPLTGVLAEELALEKVYTQAPPGENELRDVNIGGALLRDIMKYRAGQSAALKGGMVIAVEGVEGTDRMIKRAGGYCRDFTVVKIAGENKDPRFDIPVVGPETIKNMKDAGGRLLAVEAGKTVVFDEEKTVSMCDESGITLMGVSV
jgi:DUF1009 family protein